MNLGRYKIIKNMITACDYVFILQRVSEAVISQESLLIAPIASQTLVKAAYDTSLQQTLDQFDYLVPDSQWVKRAIWFLYVRRLKERVYGPELMLQLCAQAEKNKQSIYLYGCTTSTISKLNKQLMRTFPNLKIAGTKPSDFQNINRAETEKLIDDLTTTKPSIVFIALGSPKQEIFAYSLRKEFKKNYQPVIITVGAAFDFISGSKPQAPKLIGSLGFEWLYRLLHEPKRLWKRYIFDGAVFILLLMAQSIHGNKK